MGQSLAIPRVIPNDWKRLDLIINKIKMRLGRDSNPTFAELTLTGLTASRLIWGDANKALASKDLVDLVAGTVNQIAVTDDTTGGVILSITDPLAVPGKVTAGSFASPIDVTNTREYGFELHYSGNNYNATAVRARAHAVTTDTSAQFQGGLFQAANNDNVDVGVLNGLVAEAIGKATTNAATITMMRGALIGTEWSAKDTITDLRTLHVRTHTRDAVTEGYISGTGYGIYIENEAVGGNGQALSAGVYFKGTNLSAGNKAFTYGIDFSGGTYGTADIKVTEGGTIGGASADLRINSNNQVIINKTSTTCPFLINSTDGSDSIQIYHDNANARFQWTDGTLNLGTTEPDTSSIVEIRGAGIGYGFFRMYNADNSRWIELRGTGSRGYLRYTGTGALGLSLQDNADATVFMFEGATEGETRELKIKGRRTGDSLRTLEIGVGVDAADTASFDGLSNYLFDGNIKANGFLQLAQKAGTTTDGDLWNDSTQEALQTFVSGIEQTLVGVIFTQTADKTIADTTTETTLFGTGVGTLTLPANFWVVGKTIRIEIHGDFADTGNPTAQIKVKLDAVELSDSTAITLSGLGGIEEWETEVIITCRSTGVSGTVETVVDWEYETTTGSSAIERLDIGGTLQTVDTTQSDTLDVTFTWGTANALNTLTSEVGFVEVLN